MGMWAFQRLRLRQVLDDISEILLEMALDSRLMPPNASAASPSELRIVRSSASTPSLRSRDGTLPPHLRMDGGGNVRVVVRVRKFLPRGRSLSADIL